MARNVRRKFREYETEIRGGDLQWINKGFDALRRTWIGRKLSKEPESYDLGRQCAYFAIMGGYTFRPLKKLEGPDNEYTLAPEALAFLMRENIITPASFTTLRPEVADKGKSDMLAKLLVCIQAVWMVVNCISRKIAGLPLTLLELNVVMHVLCALTVYVCWWEKPHDAGRATTISQTLLDDDTWSLIYTMHKYGPRLRCSREAPIDQTSDVVTEATTPGDGDAIQPSRTTLLSGNSQSPDDKGFTIDGEITLDEHEEEICVAATRAMRFWAKNHPNLVIGADSIRGNRPYPLSTPQITMIAQQSKLETSRNIAWVLLPLCLIYGGIHATAWMSHFPSDLERKLWRISSLIVAAPVCYPVY